MVSVLTHDADEDVKLSKHIVGNALVVHRAEGMSENAKVLALDVAEDDEHDLVVVDLPAGIPMSVWDSLAGMLPRSRRRGLRLVIGGRSPETSALAGQWLAERLRRTVIAPYGAVIVGAGGALLVESGPGSGWLRFEPGRRPRWHAKRFPRPDWESKATEQLTATSSLGVAEPLPGGMWLRPVGFDERVDPYRSALVSLMACQPDVLTLVVGSPDAPPLSVDDMARQWSYLPDDVRPAARFVQYGRLSTGRDTTSGQALADLLRADVSWYTGLPIGNGPTPMVCTVGQDGRLGWWQYAREISYGPGNDGAPVLLSHRPPLPGLREISPAVYWYSPDAVVEVVQSGLLVRPPTGGDGTEAARMVTADPTVHTVSFDTSNVATADRMRLLAADLVARLEPVNRQATRVVPAAALAAPRADVRIHDHAPSPAGHRHSAPALLMNSPTEWILPMDSDGPTTRLTVAQRHHTALQPPAPPMRLESGAVPSGDRTTADPPVARGQAWPGGPAPVPLGPPSPDAIPPEPDRHGGSEDDVATPATTVPAAASVVTPTAVTGIAPTPEPRAAAVLPKDGVDEERSWLRTALGAEFGTLSNAVARVLSQHPGFQGALKQSSSGDVLTDAVAVRLYVTDRGAAVDDALRSATVGAHVPLARCVVSGLTRLPSHRGPAFLAALATSTAFTLYRAHPVVTEWGFLHTLAKPSAGLGGNTDIVVWSMTGRRTKLLEPDGGPDDRVLFVPGTRFKVLQLTEPDEDQRGLILMRELTVAETDENHPDTDRVSLDDLALTTIHRELEKLAAPAESQAGGASLARFESLPGLR
jgi:hypothetical protein